MLHSVCPKMEPLLIFKGAITRGVFLHLPPYGFIKSNSNKKMIKIKSIVSTTVKHHSFRKLKALKVLNGRFLLGGQEIEMIACVDMDSGLKLNLPLNSLIPFDDDPANWDNAKVLKLSRTGDREAVKQFIKRFKRVPPKPKL